MTFRRFLLLRALPSLRPLCLSGVFGLALLAAPVVSCGGASTDTGNPPVVVGQKLRLTQSANGVTVSGDPGAVPAGARVDVVNSSTGDTATTTAEADGSFAVELEGSVDDEYRVYTAAGTQSWRTRLTSAGASEPELGLDGLDFLLQSSQGFTPVQNTTVRLAFDDGQLDIGGGCNSLSGAYSLCDGRICVSSFSTTDIGCDAALHAQDEWLADFFTASPAVAQVGAQLTLTGSDATLVFLDREVANPDRPLVGPTWDIDTLIDGGAASNVPDSAGLPGRTFRPAVVFEEEGTLEVSTGCNMGIGTYTVTGQTLVLSIVNYTEAGCTDSGGAVEEHIIEVLNEGELSFEIDAARLTIMRGDVGIAATTD